MTPDHAAYSPRRLGPAILRRVDEPDRRPRCCPPCIGTSSRPFRGLERAGEREAAWEIRRKALIAYSTAWDSQGRRALERLHRDARHRLPRSTSRPHPPLATGTEPA